MLAYFGKRRKGAIEKYECFVGEGAESGSRPELVGGGLIRSLGGWSQVLSLRRVGRKLFSDERILGSSDFVNNVIADAEGKAKETLRLTLKISDLPSLARKVSNAGTARNPMSCTLAQSSKVKGRGLFL